MSGYEVYGNVGGLQELSADQQGHLSRFQGIMEQIQTQSESTVNKWEGSGNEQFKAKAEEFDSQFSAVNNAFAKLIDATDSASNNYAKLSKHLNNLF
ncbi:WXG100 family type VII secretion target [Lipingzhangella halophila]|uniref:WXG100 family type VII secretion target n=1 Tax=Lipingzhangella halophila TaxID=1783352 RepID=A0A7W7RLK2_9ACTN|nr:WXG100 family type VII secretion target [Lipingzhangella halophila]MBB4934235.1 WXG100 family type VII secretion target [Lipingzhangella halophila]